MPISYRATRPVAFWDSGVCQSDEPLPSISAWCSRWPAGGEMKSRSGFQTAIMNESWP